MGLFFRSLSCILVLSCVVACGGSNDSGRKTPFQTPSPTSPPIANADSDNDGVEDSEDAFPNDPDEQVDTDGDGTGDNADTDDDGDSFADVDDAFPLDSSEWADTDADGVGNNADTDDDGDNVADADDSFPLDNTEWNDLDSDGTGDNADAYPNNATCHYELDGDGDDCYLSLLDADDWGTVQTTGENLAIHFARQNKILLLNGETGNFLPSIALDENKSLAEFVYHPTHKRMYLAYTDLSVTFVDDSGIESDYTNTEEPVSALVAAGHFLILESNFRLYSYDLNGLQVGLLDYYHQASEYAWSEAAQRLYYFRYPDNPSYLVSLPVNQLSGEFGWETESPYYGNLQGSFGGPISVSPDGSELFLGGGRVIDGETMALKSSVIQPFRHATWTSDGELVTLSYYSGILS